MRIGTVALAASLVLASFGSYAGDAAAGKKLADDKCANCHEAADWAGETDANLLASIKDVAAGKVKHKSKLTLTDKEMADIAAYWATAK